MSQQHLDLAEFHWILEMLQSVDVGLVVVDTEFSVHIWNGFMENHSGLLPSEVRGENLFSLFPQLDEKWFRRKSDPVFLMKSKAFAIYEQRPYLFKFKNYRPITGNGEFMYQDVTLFPLSNTRGEVTHMCIMIYDVTDIAEHKMELEQANAKLEKLSQEDALTGLFNRGHWEQQLIKEFKREKRTHQNCSLIMLDIDKFKNLNDTFGHAAGDHCLRDLAKLLNETLRETDVCGRYGGEEFAVILIDTDGEQAMILAERLRAKIEQMVVTHNSTQMKFTATLGVAQWHENLSSHEQWIEAADEAMYSGKDGGRNKVSLHTPLA